ncbi:MAG: YfhO family protein [Lachnoclostridium sp.]|nr:YfhO family protein [Lachnoclostridium sp.]
MKTTNDTQSSKARQLLSRLTSPGVLQFIGCIAAIAVIAFAFFYPDAMEGNSLSQHDMQQGIAIGQEAKAFTEQTGEVTRWTNSLFSGMPTFQIAPSYPSSKLYMWINKVMGLGLPSPSSLPAMMMTGFLILMFALKFRWPVALTGAIAYGFSSYFIIIIGAGHIWKFLTLAYVPPTIAGIILCYRGKYLLGGALAALMAMMQIAQNHVQMTYYFLFVIIGLVIAYLVMAIRSKQMRRWGIATGVLAVAAILAVAANLPSLYNTYEYSKETMRGRHSELTSMTDAVQSTSGLDKDYITQYSYQPSETFSLLIPNIKGGASAKPEKGSMKIMSLSQLPDAEGYGEMEKGYVDYLSQYFGDPEGTNGPVYVGALIFALFLLGAVTVKGPVKWALVILTVFSILLAWGRHAMVFTDIMLAAVPMYSKFRTVESILVIAEFTMPLLAMMGLQRIVTAPDQERPALLKKAMWCFGACIVICLAAWIAPGMFGSLISDNDRMIDQYLSQALAAQGYSPAQINSVFSLNSPGIYSAVISLREGLVKADALRSLLILIAGGGFMWLYLKKYVSMGVALTVIGVVVLLDLYTVNKRYVDHESFLPASSITASAPIAKIPADDIILADTAMNYRVMDIPRFNLAAPSYYHKMIGGYHAAKLTRYQDLIDRHLSHFQNATETDADWNVLNMLNARYVIDQEGQPLLNPEAQGNAWFVDGISYVNTPDEEMATLSRIDLTDKAVADSKFKYILGETTAKLPGDTIFETSYAPNRLTYHARNAQDAVAVFSEIYFPWGWKATIDGKPAELGRVNYVLRALRLPAGEHTVEMRFDPESLHTTDAIATVSIILIFLSLVAAVALTLIRPKEA